MRIAIVDDIASERTLLRDRLEQQLGRRGVHADLTEFENLRCQIGTSNPKPKDRQKIRSGTKKINSKKLRCCQKNTKRPQQTDI